MQIEPPVIGRTYISRTKPDLSIYVVDVNVFNLENYVDTAFIVEACDPAYKDDTFNANGYDITAEVWAKLDFIPVSE